MKKKRRFGWIFWLIPPLLIGAAVVGLVYVQKSLRAFLTEYESVQVKYEVENVFRQYFDPVDYDALLRDAEVSYQIHGEEITRPAVSEFETEEAFRERLRELLSSGEISYACISNGSATGEAVQMDLRHIGQYFVDNFNASGDVHFIVTVGGKKAADIELTHTGEKTESGFDRYGFSSLYLHVTPHESVTVYAPETSTVELNGVVLGEEYRVEDVYDETESCRYMPEGSDTKGIAYVEYFVDGLFNEVTAEDLRVTDKDGRETAVEYDETNGLFRSGFLYDQDAAEALAPWVIRAIEDYSACMLSNMTLGAVRVQLSQIVKYFDTDSPLWKDRISKVEYYYTMPYNGYYFTNQRVWNFYRYDENVFSCRVFLEHHLIDHYGSHYEDDVEYEIYAHRINGEYKIYNMVQKTAGEP